MHRRNVLLGSGLLATAILTGCVEQFPPRSGDNQTNNQIPDDSEGALAGLPPGDANAEDDLLAELVSSNTRFGLDIFKYLAREVETVGLLAG